VPEQRFAFILRIWLEQAGSASDARPVLRGSLQRAGADEVRYFSSFDRVPELLQEITGWRVLLEPSETGGEQ
jgi:hypothetical protein